MPRQVRIEFPGAMYHVMARGDRREEIVRDDEDRRTFLRTLGEASERAGFRVHAWVLMSNHYHLLIETPEANLSRGMGWLQNAYTRRINTRHRLWGHVFGGRYKAILIEPGNCFWALMDYIHLNPVRVGMVKAAEGLESYRWSSMKEYLSAPRGRPKWMEAAMGLNVSGCKDTPKGRREFLEMLEERVDWKHPSKAGAVYCQGEGRPKLAVHAALRRGWVFGSQEFREKMLKLLSRQLRRASRKKADGYHGQEIMEHGERQAEALLKAGMEYFKLDATQLRQARKSDLRKGQLAEIIQAETTVKLDWISERIGMGTRSGCCKTIRKVRESMRGNKPMEKTREAIRRMTIIND